MAIMDEHITTQGNGSKVIDATRSISYVAHDHGQGIGKPIGIFSILAPMLKSRCVPLDDIRDGASKHLQALRHLESDHRRVVLSHMMDGLVDFERVIWRNLFDSSVQLGIVEDLRRYLVIDRGLHSRF